MAEPPWSRARLAGQGRGWLRPLPYNLPRQGPVMPLEPLCQWNFSLGHLLPELLAFPPFLPAPAIQSFPLIVLSDLLWTEPLHPHLQAPCDHRTSGFQLPVLSTLGGHQPQLMPCSNNGVPSPSLWVSRGREGVPLILALSFLPRCQDPAQ